jgi:hypothetical protein
MCVLCQLAASRVGVECIHTQNIPTVVFEVPPDDEQICARNM